MIVATFFLFDLISPKVSAFSLFTSIDNHHADRIQYTTIEQTASHISRNRLLSLEIYPNYSKSEREFFEKARMQNLEDKRLKACEGNGKYWEQCFFYGTDATSITNFIEDNGNTGFKKETTQYNDAQSKNTNKKQYKGPPTW